MVPRLNLGGDSNFLCHSTLGWGVVSCAHTWQLWMITPYLLYLPPWTRHHRSLSCKLPQQGGDHLERVLTGIGVFLGWAARYSNWDSIARWCTSSNEKPGSAVLTLLRLNQVVQASIAKSSALHLDSRTWPQRMEDIFVSIGALGTRGICKYTTTNQREK